MMIEKTHNFLKNVMKDGVAVDGSHPREGNGIPYSKQLCYTSAKVIFQLALILELILHIFSHWLLSLYFFITLFFFGLKTL